MISFNSNYNNTIMKTKDLNVRYISTESGLPLQERVGNKKAVVTSAWSSGLHGSDVMERRFDKYEMDYHNGNMPYEVVDEERQSEQCKQVISQLQVHLTSSPLKHPNLTLSIPPGLLVHIAKDVVFLSQGEPCGLRGCTLFVNAQQKSVSCKIAKIEFDPSIVSTFELHLTLLEDRKTWLTPVRDLIQPVLRKCRGEKFCYNMAVSTAFQIVKKKLYRNDPKRC